MKLTTLGIKVGDVVDDEYLVHIGTSGVQTGDKAVSTLLEGQERAPQRQSTSGRAGQRSTLEDVRHEIGGPG
jgi:hypothetical protein